MRINYLWSWPTRAIHWGLALCILTAQFVFVDGDKAHQALGYLALVLVLVRLSYGIWGPKSRFPAEKLKNFPIGLQSILSFIKSLRQRQVIDYSGHNPLASWVYLVLWFLVVVLAWTGWMMSWDRFWGEEWLESLHRNISWALISLVGFHLVGIVHDAIRFRRKTWMGMIDGKK